MTRTSALYPGTLTHVRRDALAQRTFRYPMLVAALDLDELPALDAELRLFSYNRRNFFALADIDYAAGAHGLRAAHAAALAAHDLPRPHAVRLVTNLRVAGYVFNPVSFFLGYDATGALTSVVAEVNNTYGGRHAYVLGPAHRIPAAEPPTFRTPRTFFVSPFLPGDATYDLTVDAPLDAPRLAITMHVAIAGSRIFTAHLVGPRHPLTDRTLAAAALRYPLSSLQVTARIYLEALKLHLLGVPYHRPPSSPATVRSPDSTHRAHAADVRASDSTNDVRPVRIRQRRWGMVQRAAVAAMRATWRGGRVDLALPGGERVRLGDAGPADATVRVHDEALFRRLLLRGELGAGESYVAGEWSTDDLVALCRTVLRSTGARGITSPLARLAAAPALARHRRAANTRAGSARNIRAHYDLGNAFYRSFLDDDTLAYSCAWWPPGQPQLSLAEAQRAKHERLCDWLALSPRDRLLELGCGWGGMAIHAASTRGCRVTAVTVSREQHALAAARVAAAGLADRVRVELRDYRDLAGTYDKLVSIEMLEAVGYDYVPGYFATAAARLAPGGCFALQTITMPDARFDAYRRRVDWMQTYVFPGSLIPSLGLIHRSAAAAGFTCERSDDIGPAYPRTLRTWRDRFVAAPMTAALAPAFVRTWLLYLAFSEAAFAERTLGDHQLLFRK